jgi:hypothetical protein
MAITKNKVPVKYYEVVDKANSGFIMDGTSGTQYQQQLTTPSVLWISSEAMSAVEEEGVKKHIKIRYINRCDSIFPLEQEKMGFTPNRFEDKIAIENGFATVERQGSTIGLYDYLEKSFYNEDNPNRPSNVPARYREVKVDKKAETLLDEDELVTHAKSLVYELRRNTGDKKIPYQYNLDRIDSICRLVNVWDESPERKLILLLQKAIQQPKEFLEIVVKAEQTVITEISHAIELGVIIFNGNTAQYCEGDKVIKIVGDGKMKPDQKAEALASWLTTEQGNSQLTELRGRIELAKEKLLK